MKREITMRPSIISTAELSQRYAELLQLRDLIKQAESNRKKRSSETRNGCDPGSPRAQSAGCPRMNRPPVND